MARECDLQQYNTNRSTQRHYCNSSPTKVIMFDRVPRMPVDTPAQRALHFAVLGTSKVQRSHMATLHKVSRCAKICRKETLSSGKKLKKLKGLAENSTQWSKAIRGWMQLQDVSTTGVAEHGNHIQVHKVPFLPGGHHSGANCRQFGNVQYFLLTDLANRRFLLESD